MSEIKTSTEVYKATKNEFWKEDVTIENLNKYKNRIEDLYYNHGFGVSRIAFAFGFKKRKNTLKWRVENPTPTEKIAFDILGYDSWDEYKREHKKVQSKVQSRKRQKAGFTQKLKKKVKERDDNKCQKCGSAKDLEVHHKGADFRNNDMDNLITLCNECHIKTEGGNPKPYANKKRSKPKPLKKKPTKGKKRKRKGNLSKKEKAAFSTCPQCGKKLANDKAVRRHVKHDHPKFSDK